MTTPQRDRWVLAFDAGCAACRRTSAAVSQASGGRLEVLALGSDEVRDWRSRALGADAPWAPTLIHVRPERVRAWTGARIVVPLGRRLGTRRTARVLMALGGLRNHQDQPAGEPVADRHGLSRKGFLRLAAGVGVASIVLAGRKPAFAKSNPANATLERWLAENRDRLPRDYDGLVVYPESYQRAMWGQLTSDERSRAWTERFRRYRADHPGLTGDQVAVIDAAVELAGEPRTFDDDQQTVVRPRLESLKAAAIAAFGEDGARDVLARLGSAAPGSSAGAPLVLPNDVGVNGCTCSTESDYCGECVPTTACYCGCYFYFCDGIGCAAFSPGCGTFYQYECDGGCGTCIGGPCG